MNIDVTFQLPRLLLLSGDISTNPGRINGTQANVTENLDHLNFQLEGKGLKIYHLNVRSFPRHLDEIQTLIRVNNFDLFLMCESWLNDTWLDSAINIDGYEMYRCDRTRGHKGGGIYFTQYLLRITSFVKEFPWTIMQRT